jgi:hypothetical protein
VSPSGSLTPASSARGRVKTESTEKDAGKKEECYFSKALLLMLLILPAVTGVVDIDL